MTVLIGTYLLLMAGAIALYMLIQYYKGAHDLLSLRNIFLTGYIIFQLISGALPLIADRFDVFRVVSREKAGMEYAVYATVYLLVFMLVYNWGGMVKTIGHRMAISVMNPPGAAFLVFMSAVFVVLAAVFRLALLVPYVGIIANLAGVGFASLAAGMVGWIWGRRIYNPAYMIWSIVIVLAAAGIAITGEFGRRNLVSVVIGLLWGMYYSQWRYQRPGKTLRRLSVMAAPAIVALALYTSVRGYFNRAGLQQQVSKMAQGSLKEGIQQLFDGQVTGQAAMWVIENYPENRPYRHLFSIKYFFMIPVPRAWWPEKPKPISTQLASQANVRGVNQSGVTLPPGVIGNSAAEGGWYALFIYAVIAGLFIRFFDQIAHSNPQHPMVTLAVGTQLGQILGLPRGEPSNFANIYILNFISVWITMILVAKTLDAFGVKRQLDVWHEDEALDNDDVAQDLSVIYNADVDGHAA